MEWKSSWTVINIKENIKMENSMAKENIFGQINHAIKANLIKGLGMAKAAGNQQEIMLIFILEHIWMIKRMDMEDMFGQMVAFMKVDLSMMLSNFYFI